MVSNSCRSKHEGIKARQSHVDQLSKAASSPATFSPQPPALPSALSSSTAMDAFTTILSILAPAADIPRPDDAPVDAETSKSSNGGGCTVSHKPVIDAPVDAETSKSSNGGGCIVA
ncbi:hypothetical protein PENSPDRAFT_654742 [Peniophora sp. CONT]|nr:hypothetical protein PENSPDRAFT_654742 [Peniophora sp. CONT]